MKKQYRPLIHMLFTPQMFFLCVVGLLCNLILSQLMLDLHVPLYLDTIGSVLVSVLGGALPGMMVAFLSKIISASYDPIMLYYLFLAVGIAWTAALFSKHGWLRKWYGCCLMTVIFIFIGGAIGSGMTWLLFDGIGQGVSAPYASALVEKGMSPFWAQFVMDMAVDIPDKIITTAAVMLFLRRYPKQLYDCFPLSYRYDRDADSVTATELQRQNGFRTISVNSRIIHLITVCALLISVVSNIAGAYYYQKSIMQQYRQRAMSASKMVAQLVNGDRIADYLRHGNQAAGYSYIQEKMEILKDDLDAISYLYVYQAQPDGFHVVFDVDADVPKDSVGTIVPFSAELHGMTDDLLQGNLTETFVAVEQPAELLTSYTGVVDSHGRITAYACADISLHQYIRDLLVFIIKMLTVQFSISILIVIFALWFAQAKLTEPIHTIVAQSLAFDQTDPEDWLESTFWKNRKPVRTGDELEMLYHTICRVEQNVAHNMTKLRENERQLRAAKVLERRNQELLLAAQKAEAANAAKTDFYSRMSHDMRTPMNGILGLVNLSKDETDSAVLQQNIAKIGDAGEYLLRLINDTLDMNKIESKKLTLNIAPVQVQSFWDGLLEMVRPNAQQKNIAFHFEVLDYNMAATVLADELRVKQIFMNLISNAVKFTPTGGQITLRLASRCPQDTMVHSRFTLQDTGVGMSEEFIQNHMYQPFSQEQNSLTAQYAGTGLGLAIVKNLVELMHGKIRVESHPGIGTTFTVDLDFEIVSDGGAAAKSAAVDAPPHWEDLRGKTILLCEDHPLNIEIAERLLEKVGIQTELAQNGVEAVQVFKQSEIGHFDAILMDIRMPIMDGMSATRKIRALDRADAKTIPIIAMTANAYAEDQKKALAAGMNAHLSKPFQPLALYDLLAEWLADDNDQSEAASR